jgi:DNA-binding transcriptional MerR regulator
VSETFTPAASTIAEVAAETGLTYRALRFYEDHGLVTPWRDGPRRLYSDEERERLRTIVANKRLGFSLAEIAEIIALGGLDKLSPARRAGQIAHLEQQRREIDEAIAALRDRG